MKASCVIRKTIAIAAMFFCCLSSEAQPSGTMVSLAGKVISKTDGSVIPYASISLSESSISNISNSEGEFTLKIPSETTPASEITISCLGYATVKLKVEKFGSKRLIVEMIPINLTLDAAVIRSSQALDILLTAYDRRELNYPQVPMGLTSFYREIIRKGNRYLSFNEAVIDINKAPYSSFKADKAGIFKSRGSMDYSKSDSLLVNYQGGVMASLQIDQAKNPFAGAEYSEMTDIYDFTMGESRFMDDRTFYVVNFNQKKNVANPFFRGSIYIDSESYTIGRIEMQMNVEGNPDAAAIFLKKKPAGYDLEVESASYIVNYKRNDNLWFFDYSRIEIKICEKKKISLFNNHYKIVSELAVTDRSLKEKHIDNTNRIRFSDILSKKVSDFTDEDFWEDYNTIEPDKSMDVIIRKIIRQLKKHSLE